MIGAADGGCAARLFVGLTLPGSPPPLCGSAAFFGDSGVARPVILSGDFYLPSRKNGLMIGAADGGCAARLFVGLTLPGSPPPLCGSAAFLGGARLLFCRKKRENQRGSRASSMRRSSSRG